MLSSIRPTPFFTRSSCWLGRVDTFPDILRFERPQSQGQRALVWCDLIEVKDPRASKCEEK